MSHKWDAFWLGLMLYLDALGLAFAIGAALRENPQHHFGSAGDGGPVGAGVVILLFVLAVAALGLLSGAIWSAVRTPREGPLRWRSTLAGVLVGFNFLMPIALGSRDRILIASVLVPSLALLLLWALPAPRRPLRLAAAPLLLLALTGIVIGMVAAALDAGRARERDQFYAIKAAIADGGAGDVRSLMDRLHWKGGAGDGQFECEAITRRRLDVLDMLLARDGNASDPSVRMMQAIRAGDGAALRARLGELKPFDEKEPYAQDTAAQASCLAPIVALSVCDGRLDVADGWTRALGTRSRVLGQLLLGLAGARPPCVGEAETFLRRGGWLLPSGQIDPQLYQAGADDVENALREDDGSFDDKPDSAYAAVLARWFVLPDLMREAIRHNHGALVAWIAKHERELDAVDRCGTTPLAAAIVDGFEELVTWLLAHGADANRAARPRCGAPKMAPLIIALQKKSEYQTMHIVPALLEHHADAKVKAPSGEDARALARKLDDKDVLDELNQAIDGPAPEPEAE